MITKKILYPMIVVLFASLSCGKQDEDSDLTFSQNCDFSGSEVEAVNRLSGSLSYVNNSLGIPPAEAPPGSKFLFLIRSPGRLDMVVCNMPVEFEMEEEESRNVTFSGSVVVPPNGFDALSTDIELNYLKFE